MLTHICHKLCHRGLSGVLLEHLVEVSLQLGVSALGSFQETVNHARLTARIGLRGIVAHAVLELEDLALY